MIDEILLKYKNKFRIILVYTNDYNNKEYINSKELYKKNIVKFNRRFVKLVSYKSNKNNFKIELIGFDGKLKKIYKKMDVETIINDIEKMPMGYLRNNK